jgi:K(+)-stimulated pyrophosphate-energized sodium pump
VFDYLFLGYPSMWSLAPISSGLGIIISLILYKQFKKEANEFISEGVREVKKSQNRTIYPFLILVALVLSFISYKQILPWMSLYSFIFGSFIFIPLQIFTVSTGSSGTKELTDQTDSKLSKMFINVFRTSGAINIMSLSLATMGLSICFATNLVLKTPTSTLTVSIISFCLGLFIPIFMNSVIGSVFTKSIDSASDNVAENEEGLSSNSMKNPAVLAQKSSRLVFSLINSSSNALETWLLAILTVFLISANISVDHLALVFTLVGLSLLLLIFFSLISFARAYWKFKKIWIYLRASYFTFIGLFIPTSYYLINSMLENSFGIFISLTIGVLLALISAEVSYYYMSRDHTPLQKNILTTKLGAPFIISSAFATAMISSWIPVILLLLAALVSYINFGLFGLAITALGMALMIGITSVLRTYSVLSKHLVKEGEMIELESHKKDQLANLQKIGDRSSSLIRNNDIMTLMIISIPLLSSIQEAETQIQTVKLFLILLTGAISVFILSGFVLKRFSLISQRLAEELKRQFSEIIKKGNSKPFYNEFIKIANKGAMLTGIISIIFAISAPILFGLVAGKTGNLTFMIGLCATGFSFYMIFYGSGQIWTSIKEFIEQDKMGGPGSVIHNTAVIADTVGAPLKSAVANSIKSYIKLAMILSLLFSEIFAKYSVYISSILF